MHVFDVLQSLAVLTASQKQKAPTYSEEQHHTVGGLPEPELPHARATDAVMMAARTADAIGFVDGMGVFLSCCAPTRRAIREAARK
jgi:hypothetical protein